MADLLIDKPFVDNVKKENGTVLSFDNLSDSVKEKLRDEHIIGIIDKHFMLACAIKEIDLTDCVGITDATLVHIANKCKRLKHLFVSRCVNITEDGIQAIAEKIGKNLDSLYYIGCNRCTDAALQAVVQHCPNLRDFRISGNPLQHPPPPLEVAQRPIKGKQHSVSRAANGNANATCIIIACCCYCCLECFCCPCFYFFDWCAS
jgi:hypothetical protein